MSLPSDPVAEVRDIVIAIVVLLVIAGIGYLVWDNHHLEGIVASQNAEIADYKSANEQFATQATAQNAAIQKMQDDANARQKAVAKLIATAEKSAADMYARAGKIMGTQSTGDECEAAKNLLNSYFGGK